MKKLIISIVFLLLAISCASKEKIEGERIAPLKNGAQIEKLTYHKVTVPPQENSTDWDNNYHSQVKRIENFTFTETITQQDSVRTSWTWRKNYHRTYEPIIMNDKIYVLNSSGEITIHKLNQPQEILQQEKIIYQNGKNLISGKMTYCKNKIFLSMGSNEVVALSATDLSELWYKRFNSTVVSAPVCDESLVFVITSDSRTFALNSQNGYVEWSHKGISKNLITLGSANPVIYKNTVISAYASGEVYALDKVSGKIKWVRSLVSPSMQPSEFVLNDIDTTPIVKDDIVYMVGHGGKLIAINFDNAQTLWERDIASLNNFWVAGNFLFLIDNQSQLKCLYIRDGKTVWSTQLPKSKKERKRRMVYYSLKMIGDRLYTINSTGNLIIIEPITGQIIQEDKLGKRIYHQPVVVNNKMYLNSLGRFGSYLMIFE